MALFNRALTLAEAESIWSAGSVAAVIPEPAAALLGSLGMLALLRRRRA